MTDSAGDLTNADADADTDTRRGAKGNDRGVRLLGYHPAASLSRLPHAVGRFELPPISGGDSGLGGRIAIRIWISEQGDIDHMRVRSSGLPDAYQQAALAAFNKLRFVPGEINGAPVQSWVDIVVEFADFRSEGSPEAGARK